MMISPNDPIARVSLAAHISRLWILVLLLGLAGCGPGTGGTGTGPVYGTVGFGGNIATGVSLEPGLVCQGDCSIASLRLEDERVELTAACRRFIHVGSWTLDSTGRVELHGILETHTNTGPLSSPAILQLQFSATEVASQEVTMMIRREDGHVLLDTVRLQRDDTAAPAATLPTCLPV